MTVQVTPAMIKDLRERTGVGMTKCKQALEEANGDMDLAIENLRKSGMATAVKKEGRETKEGLIASSDTKDVIALVEVMAETDFVVNNERFRQFLINMAEEVASSKPASLEAFGQQTYSKDPSMTIEQYRATLVQTLGENIQIRRLKTIDRTDDVSVGVYMHLGGKICTVVEIKGSNGEEALAKDIAMHVAAASPEFLSPEFVPASVIESEKEVARGQMVGKPANIIDKIIEGKMKAYYDESCLVCQKYIKDDKMSVADVVSKRAKETGKPLTVAGFTRWSIGQK
jgi:elongation factor Ts